MKRRTWALVLGLALLSMGAVSDRAPNPYDAEQRRLAAEVVRSARSAQAVLPLLEIMRNAGMASPDVTRAELQKLSRERRLSVPLRAQAAQFLALAEQRAGESAAAAARFDELGFVTDFQIIGPFDNEGKAGLDRRDPAEALFSGAFDAAATFAGKERDVTIRPYPDVSPFSYVNFDAVFRPFENVCGIAYTTVTSARAQPLALLVGASGAMKLFWNGEQVFKDGSYRQSAKTDRQAVVVAARQGHNRLGVKVCAMSTEWGFFLRATAADGSPARGIEVSSESMPEPAAAPAQAPTLPAAPVMPLAALTAAAESPKAKPADLEALARYLEWTGSDDDAEHRARQLAARAANEAPTLERLELAASLAEQRGEAMRFVAEAERRFGSDPKTQLLVASLKMSSLHPVDALPILDRLVADATGLAAADAMLVRAQLLAELGFSDTALAQIDELAALTPKAHDVVRLQSSLASTAGQADRAIERARAAVALRWDDQTNRRVLVADAIRRQDDAALDEQLAVLHQLSRDSGAELSYIAAVLDARGKEAESLELRQEARALAPHDAEAAVNVGRYLLRIGQDDAAAAALRAALALRPQDASTRELLEQLRPEERPDERYAVASDEILSRRTETSGYPSSILQDLTVNTVFANGLGTSFHQLAMQVHDEEGARQLRTYGIQFDPSSQRVDVRLARVYRANGDILEGLQTYEQSLGEPWYRIYYDTRALVVVFPNLEPGDTIELRYRIDDVTHRNVFADYYGDLYFFNATVPKKHVEYVLITPERRQMYFNEPELPGLQHEQEVESGTRVDRFFADNVAALRPEAGMPGPTETYAYLHVSTYESWEAVGRWYWGLIQDQLYADVSLKRTVAELVAGAPDLETKVKRIHEWVLDHTRYVGLEFGIHGYKPYRVPQIVERGFGDCKDKASLLYTMFREAGIDAHVVLVRTRRNGAIPALPASLAVFDHAIAYVPGLDLYIDGTAENSGLRELPGQDQGVTVLHVWPEGSALRRTPVLGPEQSVRARRMDITLANDGGGTMAVNETITGGDAATYRRLFQAPGTRAERLERALRASYPGSTLESQSFESIDDRNAPVRFEYRARDPQLARVDGTQLRLEASSSIERVQMLATTPRRSFALELSPPNRSEEERRVTLPPGARIAGLPEGGVAESEFGRVSVQAAREGAAAVVRTEVEIRVDRVSADQYPAFRRWVEAATQLLRQRINIEASR